MSRRIITLLLWWMGFALKCVKWENKCWSRGLQTCIVIKKPRQFSIRADNAVCRYSGVARSNRYLTRIFTPVFST